MPFKNQAYGNTLHQKLIFNTKLEISESSFILTSLGNLFFIVVKYVQHKIYNFNHF